MPVPFSCEVRDMEESKPPEPTKPASLRHPRRRKLLIWAGGPVALTALVMLGLALHQFFTHESTDDAFVDAHVSAIAARVEGQVTLVAVDDNRPVKKGDLLAEIDPPTYQARLDQARANLVSAIAAARRADLDLIRYQKLLRTDDATRQRVDQARADADAAHANIQVQEAAIRQAALDLSYTRVVAPQDGWVTHKSVEVGDYLKVGQALLAVVPRYAYVTANFKETQLKHMKPGQPVTIKVDAYSGRKFKGHVDSIQAGTGAQFSLL